MSGRRQRCGKFGVGGGQAREGLLWRALIRAISLNSVNDSKEGQLPGSENVFFRQVPGFSRTPRRSRTIREKVFLPPLRNWKAKGRRIKGYFCAVSPEHPSTSLTRKSVASFFLFVKVPVGYGEGEGGVIIPCPGEKPGGLYVVRLGGAGLPGPSGSWPRPALRKGRNRWRRKSPSTPWIE